MNSVRESPGMKEVWTSLVHVWVSSTNGNIHSFSLLGTFQQFLDVVPQRLFLLWNCYENIKLSQNNNSMKCSWGDEREPKPPMTPGWAGAWLCSSGTCRCCLPGKCVCLVLSGLWAHLGATAGLFSEGTRCWNCSPHSELQKLMRCCYGVKILNETNSKAGRAAEKSGRNNCQDLEVGIVSDSQQQICDKDVILYWMIEAGN